MHVCKSAIFSPLAVVRQSVFFGINVTVNIMWELFKQICWIFVVVCLLVFFCLFVLFCFVCFFGHPKSTFLFLF